MELPDTFELNAKDIKYEGAGLYKRVQTDSLIGEKDSPIHIHLATDTDWWAVTPAAAGVVVALLVAWLTVGVQRTQIQGNISNFRHHWMTELREAATELIVTLRLAANSICKKDNFKQSDAYWEYSKVMLKMHSRVSFLLSRNGPIPDSLRLEGAEIIRSVLKMKRRDSEFQVILDDIDAYQDALRAELEEAWDDAKNDLGFNRRFLLFRMFKKDMPRPQRAPFRRSTEIDWDNR